MKRFQGGLVFEALRLVYHPTLGLRTTKLKKWNVPGRGKNVNFRFRAYRLGRHTREGCAVVGGLHVRQPVLRLLNPTPQKRSKPHPEPLSCTVAPEPGPPCTPHPGPLSCTLQTYLGSWMYRLGRDPREGCAVKGTLHVCHPVLHLPIIKPPKTRNTLPCINI